jgi:hypothetical protein
MLPSHTTRLGLLTLLGTILAAATIAPGASAAAQRYASPTGAGTASCTSALPCSITKAVSGAGIGDEVIVKPGDYSLTKTLAAPSAITIHGVAGQPRPRLLFSGAGQDGVRVVSSSTLQYVTIQQAAGGGALFAGDSVVDQVIARASGQTETATIQSSTIRNSIVVASWPKVPAITTSTSGATNTSTYRNVTAIATGSGGVAILAKAGFAAGKATVHLVNVMARGAGTDLEARTDGSGAQATITATHTNYASHFEGGTNAAIISGGGNQSAFPAWVNGFAGDFRQAAGSPTIDAGLDEPWNGTLDVDGDPRTRGTTDIGADEFYLAPAATTGAAGAVTDHSATLSGSVTAKGAPTTYRFQYGPTTAYGSATPVTAAGLGTAAVVAGATLSGLRPATTYHFRIVATNSGGVARGVDRTFTTTAAPTATPPATQAFAGVRLVSTRLRFAHRFITVKLTCPAATDGRCSGRTKLTARRRRTSARVTLGRTTFSIAAGLQARVRVRASRAGRRRLAGVRRLRGRATNAARNAAGQSRTTAASVTIRRRHR